jgi:superfamily II DNA or RNA helicase
VGERPIVKILDAVHCEADKEARLLIAPILKYREAVWIKKPMRTKGGKLIQRRVQKVVDKTLMTGRKGSKGLFLTGLLPRVRKRLKKKIYIEGTEEVYPIQNLPKLPGITFREDQKRALRAVRRRNRGKIVFPTGSGKTVIAGGIVAMFSRSRIVFLCHTSDLVSQTREEFIKWFGKKRVYAIGGGYKDNIHKVMKAKAPVLIATVQSYIKLPQKKLSTFWDVTIVDEVHHVNSKESMYGSIMERNLCPRRYGLTATVPSKRVQLLTNEGYFGPKIAELSVQEGVELGIIAKPRIDLIPVPYDVALNQKCSTYQDYYEKGIVENRKRNKLICRTVKKKEITLIVIERTEHGKLLQKMLKLKGYKAPFVYGGTKREVRERVKNKLKSGKLRLAICSRVWKEGINIPALNHIVNACGMKEEKAVLQAVGRGLRTAEGKDIIRVTDFLDPYKHLAGHSVQRVGVYVNQGWL